MRKVTKKILKILTGIIGAILLLALSLYLLIRIPAVQLYCVRQATGFLSEKLQTKVSVGSVDYQLFDHIVLRQVYVEDQSRDSLLYAETLQAGVSLRNLIRNRIVFKELALDKMRLRLQADSVGDNFRFVIDAFASDQPAAAPLYLQFRSVRITDSYVRFDRTDKPVDERSRTSVGERSRTFDANHVEADNLHAQLQLNLLTGDSLSATIHNLAFSEHSGFSLRRLQAHIEASPSKLELTGFNLDLPQTRFVINRLNLRYGKLENLRHFADSVAFDFSIARSAVTLADFACFVPTFRQLNEPVYVAGAFYGKVADLHCPQLNLAYGETLSLTGNFDFKGLPDICNTQTVAQISNLKFDKSSIETLVSDFRDKPFVLPDNLSGLGTLRFDGQVSGSVDKFLTQGHLLTQAGELDFSGDVAIRDRLQSVSFSGKMDTKTLHLGKILNNEAFGEAVFNLQVSGEKTKTAPLVADLQGNVASLQYNGYRFQNIALGGKLDNSTFDGDIHLRDENGNADFNGFIDFSAKTPCYNFFARLENLSFNKMKLLKSYPDLSLSLLLNTRITTDPSGGQSGTLSLDSLVVDNKDIHWKNTLPLKLSLENLVQGNRFGTEPSTVTLQSDFVNGSLTGYFTPASIAADVREFLSGYLPALTAMDKAERNSLQSRFECQFRFSNLPTLSRLFNLPLLIADGTTLESSFNEHQNSLLVHLNAPRINYNRIVLSNVALQLANHQGGDLQLSLDFDTQDKTGNPSSHFFWKAFAQNNQLNFRLLWQQLASPFCVELITQTRFSRDADNRLLSDIEILPSEVLLNDTIWNIRRSRVQVFPERIAVSNFRFEQGAHSLRIDGIASKSDEEGIRIKLNDLYLRYLNMFVSMGEIELDGCVSGDITLHNVLDKFFFTSNVRAEQFSFNGSVWGDASVLGTWDKEEQNIRLAIDVKNRNIPVLTGRGAIYPLKDSIELTARAQGLKADFLRPFLDNVVQDFGGEISTNHLRLFGKTFNPYFDGDVYMKNGRFGIDFLKTAYTFSDTIFIKRDEIRFKNLKIADSENHTGTVSGFVNHKRWKDFRYNIGIKGTNMLVLNTRAKDNGTFYGKVYGTGNIRISGNRNAVNFDVAMSNGANSLLVIPLSGVSNITSNDFIRFKPKYQAGGVVEYDRSYFDTPSPITMTLHLQVDANPDATVQVIIDPNAGDAITASGSGNLTMDYSNKGALKLLGTYTVEQGSYLFTFQDIIRRTFKIKQGSSMRWTGSPYEPQLDIDAYYSLTASLTDILDDAMLADVKRVNVPVNCLMNIAGNMQKPDIKFDLELPSSDEEVKRRVKSIINSDDMMSRQIAYLLTLGRFFAPEYLSNASMFGSSNNEQALAAVASSSISGQLNQWLSQVTDKVNLGVNYRPDNATSAVGSEFDVAISTELFNRRVIFNGNVGYRENAASTGNTTRFIGDFDLEYKLTKSGKLRAKVYSHSNDIIYYKEASLYTQGLGLKYTEQFDNLRDYWKSLFTAPPIPPKGGLD